MKTKDTKSITADKQYKPTARRKLLKNAVLVAGGATVLPTSWTKPIVDTVFLPAHAMTSCKTICEIAQTSGVHKTLVQLLSDTGLLDTVCNAPELTVWAPTDAAFEAISGIEPPLSNEEATEVLLYHTASGTNPASDKPGANVSASIPACNGIVHVIDEVLIPPGFRS